MYSGDPGENTQVEDDEGADRQQDRAHQRVHHLAKHWLFGPFDSFGLWVLFGFDFMWSKSPVSWNRSGWQYLVEQEEAEVEQVLLVVLTNLDIDKSYGIGVQTVIGNRCLSFRGVWSELSRSNFNVISNIFVGFMGLLPDSFQGYVGHWVQGPGGQRAPPGENLICNFGNFDRLTRGQC